MPCVSRLLEKGRFPGRWLPACAVLLAPLLLLLLLAEPAAPLAHQPALPGVCQPASSQQLAAVCAGPCTLPLPSPPPTPAPPNTPAPPSLPLQRSGVWRSA